MGGWIERLYAASPTFLQQIGAHVYGWPRARRRFGGVFERVVREYIEREGWSPASMRAFVTDQLRSQLRRAYEEVPYYRDTFARGGIDASAISRFTPDDLPRLPLLEKSFVRSTPQALLTESALRRPPAILYTSGTTGTPISVYYDNTTHQHVTAAREARSYHWAGVSFRQPRSVIGGRLVVPEARARPPFWRYSLWDKQVYFSTFHISPRNVPHYVSALNRFKPVTLTGYASANFFLARLIGELGLAVHSPKAAILGSERLEPHMRRTLEEVYRTRVYEEYGSVENCALATECERGRLHVHPDFGIVEILRSDGTPAETGQIGEIVATGFANTNQLFIRYRTGDLAAWDAEPCPCGRDHLPVIRELVGRLEDTVVGPDGREMVRFHGLYVGIGGIVEGQLVQHAADRYTVNVVPSASYSPADGEEVSHRLKTRLGEGISVEFRLMSEIPRGPNGKFRAVVSYVERTPENRLRPAAPHKQP